MDTRIIESGNGGDLVSHTRDLAIAEGFENMPYLALFGGNPGHTTPITRPDNTLQFDWWGNALFYPREPALQFNSLTEKTLDQVALTPSGRILIEEAVLADLDFMRDFAEVEVKVSIIDHDKVKIAITVGQPDTRQDKAYEFIWDATLKGLTDNTLSVRSNHHPPVAAGIFDPTFDPTFA